MKKILALVLAMMMVMALCACGDTAEVETPAADDAVVEAAPAADAAEAPAEDGASGEPTGEPVAELFDASGYSKDLEGYKQYAIDALKSDEHAPADVIETTVAAIEAVTDGAASDFDMMVNQGRILSYDEFIAG